MRGQLGTGTGQGRARDKEGVSAHLGTVGSSTFRDRDSGELDMWGLAEVSWTFRDRDRRQAG